MQRICQIFRALFEVFFEGMLNIIKSFVTVHSFDLVSLNTSYKFGHCLEDLRHLVKFYVLISRLHLWNLLHCCTAVCANDIFKIRTNPDCTCHKLRHGDARCNGLRKFTSPHCTENK